MNSDNVKKIPFLKMDVNQHHSYELIKSGKSVLNLPNHQIYNQHHSTIHDFTLNPKNNVSDFPFSGNSSWYCDFELPKLNYCYHQFVLRYTLQSNDSNDIYVLPVPLQIDRLVLLKNSNVLSEVNSEDILYYNLHKISNKYDTSFSDYDYNYQLGLIKDYNNPGVTTFNSSYFIDGGVNINTYAMELPLCLTNSNFLSSAIKNELVIRIYFKGAIISSNVGSNTNIKMSDLKLMLRMKETSHNLYKEPKFNHQFTKKILTKININSLQAGQQYNINITGFNSVASFCFIFLRDLDNNINQNTYGTYHTFKYRIDDVSLVDNTGKNILASDMILQKDYNKYLIIHRLIGNLNNDGFLYLLPFCYDGNISYNTGFSGGYNFGDSSKDYKLRFKSVGTVNRNLILNILWFSPSLLELQNGDLTEILSSN